MTSESKDIHLIEIAQTIFLKAAEALTTAHTSIGKSFLDAVSVILNHKGKIVVIGVGKSGAIAQKIASTLCSTGTPAVYLHAGEAVHGDLGVYQPGDPTLLISKSGNTLEIMRLIPILKQFQSPLIALVGKVQSPIAKASDIVLDATIVEEGDPLGLVPTTSSLVALAFGDALTAALIHARSFNHADFARYHPAGQLGRNLLLNVADVMRPKNAVPCLDIHASLKDAIIAMTHNPMGAACILDKKDHLVGLITDGDIRRALRFHDDIRTLSVKDIMTTSPIVTTPVTQLGEAIRLMEDRPATNQLSVLPVTDAQSHLFLGLLRLHDAYQPYESTIQ